MKGKIKNNISQKKKSIKVYKATGNTDSDSDYNEMGEIGKHTHFSDEDEEELTSGSDEIEKDENEDSEDSEDSEDDSANEEETAKAQLADAVKLMSFQELASLQRKIGTKKFENTIQPLINSNIEEDRKNKNSVKQGSKKKPSKKVKAEKFDKFAKPTLIKNAPREISSKQKAGNRKVIIVKNAKSRDPRFEPMCGSFDQNIFDTKYDFLQEIQEKEDIALQKEMNKTKDLDRKQEIKDILGKRKYETKLKNQIKKKQEIKRQRRKEEEQRVREGKNPFFIKKSEEKKLDLAEKYRGLKEKGKVDDFMAKRRKKVATKDHRYVPYKRE